MKILWLGTVVDDETATSRRAVSMASNQWQGGLIRGLRDVGADVRAIGHLPEPAWPRGEFRLQERREAPVGVPSTLVGYWNLPYARVPNIVAGHLAQFEAEMTHGEAPDVVISYNARVHRAGTALVIQELYGIPWVCIVADRPAGWPEPLHDPIVSKAAGQVFLPWNAYVTSAAEHRLHLDGGVDGLRPREASDVKSIMYAGTLNPHKGIDFLTEAFELIDDDSVELWVCGPGRSPRLEKAAEADERIKVHGLVPRAELYSLMARATVFVNPRDPRYVESENSFPSKILEYLSYATPVVSTWTPGLSPAYRDVLTVCDAATPQELAGALENVLGWSHERQEAERQRIGTFLSDRTWRAQAERFLQWLGAEITSA